MLPLSNVDSNGIPYRDHGTDAGERAANLFELDLPQNKFVLNELPGLSIYPRDSNSVIMIPSARFFDTDDPKDCDPR